jgi:roadblock/LC7 domain-containing protein
MVGFISMSLPMPESSDNRKATLFIPRALPGHEETSDLLIEQSLEVLHKKSVRKVEIQVSTMFKNSAALMEGWGFAPSQDRGWGYKIYYSYTMLQGEVGVHAEKVYEVNTSEEHDESADLATNWYKMPKGWCRNLLDQWHATGEVITHSYIRHEEKMVAACMAAPNNVRKDTAAMYFVYVRAMDYLPPLVSWVVHSCIQKGCKTLIVDLINEQHSYENVYRSLGFEKSADWAVYEKEL